MNKGELNEYWEAYARLLTLSALHEARIKANPVPHLNKMAEQYCRLRMAVEDAIGVIDGMADFDMATDQFPDIPPSLVDCSLMRQHRASLILREALKTGESDERSDIREND